MHHEGGRLGMSHCEHERWLATLMPICRGTLLTTVNEGSSSMVILYGSYIIEIVVNRNQYSVNNWHLLINIDNASKMFTRHRLQSPTSPSR